MKGKTAIITGAGQGIGLAIAKKLVANGANVILNDLDAELCKRAEKNVKCLVFPGDSSDLNVISAMVKMAVSNFGRLDIAIANAGITLYGNFFSYSPDAFANVLHVNLGGTFFLAQHAANQMKTQSSGGSLLFTSSVTGHQAHKDLAAYSMTKAAIEMLAKNLVIEVSSFNINVNAIAPGATLTERTLEDEEYESTWSKITPMGRPSTVEDIANAAMFLVSDEARQITGQTLVIDGGWSCISPPPFS
jgi:glucose 1-dehydrogenase